MGGGSELLTRCLAVSLARWHIHPTAISCPSRALDPEEREHAPGKFSDVRLGCRIMEPSPRPLINESGAVTQAGHEKELVAGSLRWVCSAPGGGGGSTRESGHPALPRALARVQSQASSGMGQEGAGSEAVLAAAPSSEPPGSRRPAPNTVRAGPALRVLWLSPKIPALTPKP